jgi:hypothetical protein
MTKSDYKVSDYIKVNIGCGTTLVGLALSHGSNVSSPADDSWVSKLVQSLY